MKTKHSGLIMGPAAAPQAPAATKFWNMASTGDDEGEITLYGDVMSQQPVDWWTGEPEPGLFITPEGFMEDLAAVKDKGHITVKLNSCIAADLYGQVASESSGLRQISGTGGQLDFLTGAAMARGGKAFICMTSTFTDKQGVRHSRILPHFGGDIVTSPRSQAYYLATEYGVVNLAGRSTWERAEALVSIAHPDFREQLIAAAESQKIWRRSAKR